MKKYLKLYFNIGLAFLVFALGFIQITYAQSGRAVLLEGMHSQEVITLQSNLTKLGYFKQTPTDYFGPVTEAAVLKFQKDHAINPDGKVGTNTYSKIDMFLNAPVLKIGMSGKNVTAIQSNLKKLGYFNQESTGYFGDITQTAVKNFQKQYSLNITGVADTLTYVKIDCLLNKSNGIKIVIDPGHGGIDKGTSKGNVVESEVTLSVAKKLKTYLEDDGYSIVLTRDKDVALDSLSNISGTREQKDLDARTKIIDKSGAKMFVSVHVNSDPDSPASSGSIVFYNDKLPESKIIAQNIQKVLNSISIPNFKRQTHDPQEADYYILRNSDVPGVLVETAFVTNANEQVLLATDAFREKIAKAIISGIENTNFN